MNKNSFATNKTSKINIITLICITSVMLFFNFNCGYISDDWHFKFVFNGTYPTDESRYIQSIEDIIFSLKNFYYSWGGRVFCHGLIFLINMFPKAVFNIINSLMFTLLGYLAYTVIKSYTKTDHRFLLPSVYVIFMLFLPRFGDNCLWLSGSINYLWSGVIHLTCLICINKFAKDPTPIKALLLCIAVLISSLTNEMTGGMVIIYMLLTFIFEYGFKAYYFFIFIPAAAASVFVVSAPGNGVRSGGIIQPSAILRSILTHSFQILKIHYCFAILFLCALIIAIKYRKSLKPFIGGLKLSITGIAGIMALSFSGQIDYRPYFIGCVPFLTGGVLCALNIYEAFLSEQDIDIKKICRCISTASFVCIAVYILGLFVVDEKFETFETLSVIPLIVMAVILLLSILITVLIKCIGTKKLHEFIKRIGTPQKYIPAAVMIAVIPYLTVNMLIYLNNCNARRIWFENAEMLISSGEYDAVLNMSNPVNFTGIFDPDSSYFMDNSFYVIGWLAYDNGIYIDPTN